VFPGLPDESLGAVGFSLRRRLQSRRLSYLCRGLQQGARRGGRASFHARCL